MEYSNLLTRRALAACFLTTFITLFIVYVERVGSRTSFHDFIMSRISILRQNKSGTSYPIQINGTSEVEAPHPPEWNPYMDILDENEVLKDKPLYDMKEGLSLGLSRVILKGNSKVFQIGDEIRIGITPLDGYGKVRRRGGDQFRVRIFEKALNASASGYVVDHKNGTYTAVVRALWPGRPIISIVNGFPREIVRAWYYTLNKLPAIQRYLAKYRVKTMSKFKTLQGLCHPILDRILTISNKFCNRTNQNGGAALYCHRPELATCKNFIGYTRSDYRKRDTFTKAELNLSERYGEVLKSIQVSVRGKLAELDQDSNLACVNYNVSKLWLKESPIGFFYKNVWRTTYCKGLPDKVLGKCVTNKHFILVGDSTLRQWFEYIVNTYNCTLKIDRMMYKTCFSSSYNMSAEFSFHSIPGHYIVEEPTIHSIHQFIDKYKCSHTHILVFHMQSHLSTYHPRVFRERMLQIRKSIENLLAKYKNLRIYFKGPNTFKDRYKKFCDYFGYVYRTIMLDIFEGLYDKIVYLDSKDMTIATAQIDNHPTGEVVRGMVNQLLSYVCEDRTTTSFKG